MINADQECHLNNLRFVTVMRINGLWSIKNRLIIVHLSINTVTQYFLELFVCVPTYST